MGLLLTSTAHAPSDSLGGRSRRRLAELHPMPDTSHVTSLPSALADPDPRGSTSPNYALRRARDG